MRIGSVRLGLLAGAALSVVLGWSMPSYLGAQRLPTDVRPEHYALTITPDLKMATFAGVETIDVVTERETDSITLNAAQITFIDVKAKAGSGELLPGAVSVDADRQQATIHFARRLPAGRVALTIAYTGILNDRLRGFYLSKRQDAELRRHAV